MEGSEHKFPFITMPMYFHRISGRVAFVASEMSDYDHIIWNVPFDTEENKTVQIVGRTKI